MSFLFVSFCELYVFSIYLSNIFLLPRSILFCSLLLPFSFMYNQEVSSGVEAMCSIENYRDYFLLPVMWKHACRLLKKLYLFAEWIPKSSMLSWWRLWAGLGLEAKLLRSEWNLLMTRTVSLWGMSRDQSGKVMFSPCWSLRERPGDCADGFTCSLFLCSSF